MEVKLNRRTVVDRINYLETKRKEMRVQLHVLNLSIAEAYKELGDADPDKSDMMDFVKDGFSDAQARPCGQDSQSG